MSDLLTQSSGLHLSKNPETEGFDLQAGESWIYPTNYPVRDYQFNITQKALLKNTLVSLPTGLGKTFIAAVVMFNYFRWYPQGKVVFMAPTRPLVKQQIDACYDIMAIPKEATAEITGIKISASREEVWKEKRVFFITPQILQNDLDKFQSLGTKIKCLVFDEAHRARGNHAYCEVIRKLTVTNKFFRVLALSATPGGTIEDVLEVVQNLLISHLEFRTEESLDVSPYVFQRNLTTVVVPLGEKLQQVKDDYMKVLEYDTRTLIKYKIIQGNYANLTKGKIFMLLKNFQQGNKSSTPHYQEIMKTLHICVTLYHGAELLIRHGLRNFLTFFDEHKDKPLLRGNTAIREILADIREYLGPSPPQVQCLPDGGYPIIPDNVKFGHPKFYKLRDVLIEHFQESDTSSRVIVFFEYRESVMEAFALLTKSQPVIRPRIFVGQRQGVTQKLQINVVKAFREGTCNVLLSTSIGEEGLDVGEVDLIVCFDISNKSPIRMVQRMGRTGRKKDGNIIVLVTEGKEQQTLKDCLIHKNNVAVHVLGSKQLANSLRTECPKLIPEGLTPKCQKIFVTVLQQPLKKGGNLKDMLRSLSSKSSELSFSPNLEIMDVPDRIPKTELYLRDSNAFSDTVTLPKIFSKKIEKQRSFQETHQIQHSEKCELLVSLLQMAESRRFNIPMSQISKSTSIKQFKQTDIRNMFKSQSAKDFEPLPPTPSPIIPNTMDINEDKLFDSSLFFTELTIYLTCLDSGSKKCKLCPTQMCMKTPIPARKSSKTVLNWIEPDSSLYTSITLEDLVMFEKNLDKSINGSFQFNDTLDCTIPNVPIGGEAGTTLPESEEARTTPPEKISLEFADFVDNSILGELCHETSSFQAPKSAKNILSRYSVSIMDELVESQKCKKETSQKMPPHERGQGVTKKVFSDEDIKNILNFFKLEKLVDIFEDVIMSDSQETITYSPDLFNESIMTGAIREKTPTQTDGSSDDAISPIVSTFASRKKCLKKFSSPSLLDYKSQDVVNSSIKAVTISSTHTPNSPITSRRTSPIISRRVNPTTSRRTSPITSRITSPITSRRTSPITSTLDAINTDNKKKDQSQLEDLYYNSQMIPSNPKNVKTVFSESKSNSRISPITSRRTCPITSTLDNKKKDQSQLEDLYYNSQMIPSNPKNVKTVFSESKSNSRMSPITSRRTSPMTSTLDAINTDNKKKDQLELEDLYYSSQMIPSNPKNVKTLSSESKPHSRLDPRIFTVDAPRAVDTERRDQLELEDFCDLSSFGLTLSNDIAENVDRKIVRKDSEDEKELQTKTLPDTNLDYFFGHDVPKDIETNCDKLEKTCDIDNVSKSERLRKVESPKSLDFLDMLAENTKELGNGASKPSGSQVSVTQVLYMINQPTPLNVSSQKENLKANIDLDDSDFFNFSFNTKKVPKSLNKSSSNKTKKNQLNSTLDESSSSADTTLGSNSSSKSPLKAKISPTKKCNLNDSFFYNSQLNHTCLKSPSNTTVGSKLMECTKNISNSSCSDDKFESKPVSSAWIKSKTVCKKRKLEENSDDDFETSITSPVFPKPKPVKRSKTVTKRPIGNKTAESNAVRVRNRKLINHFIEDEAEVSICDPVNISDDELESASQDCYDPSFVTDETQNLNTQMHVMYLKSVRSPVLPNRFKIPRTIKNNVDVFSQPETCSDDTYLDDSFVVHDETIDTRQELSQLEILEKQLEMQRKRKKMSKEIKKPSKKRIICIDSDSD